MGFDLREWLANLGVDSRFILFVLIDAAVGIVSLGLFLSVWLTPVAGIFALTIGSLVALVNFLLRGIPSAIVWAIATMVCLRFGASLRLACTIAAPITVAFACAFLFVAFGFWIGDGKVDIDGANALALGVAPISILLAPVIAWKIYSPAKEVGIPISDLDSERSV